MIKHIVDGILMCDWRKVSKVEGPVDWCACRMAVCGLLMSREKLGNIVRAAESWRTCVGDLQFVVDEGSALTDSLFSQCVVDAVEASVEKAILVGMQQIVDHRPLLGAKLNAVEIDRLKAHILKSISEIAGAHLPRCCTHHYYYYYYYHYIYYYYYLAYCPRRRRHHFWAEGYLGRLSLHLCYTCCQLVV